ncbi:hypothetical protein [Clostridium niameyense]|nr:hypothetical protein [Clostridium niameyense]
MKIMITIFLYRQWVKKIKGGFLSMLMVMLGFTFSLQVCGQEEV